MKVVIVGSGAAGIGLAEELKRQAPDASIALITRDTQGFYSRPSLSHCFSQNDSVRRIVIKTFPALASAGIEVRAGTDAIAIARPTRQLEVTNADGSREQLAYDCLVLAPGSEAFVPPAWGAGREHFFVLNRLEDMQAMRALRERVAAESLPTLHWAIVGGGLIGLELASDLRKAGDAVTVYHAADRLMERTLDAETSERLLGHLRSQEIEVLLGQRVEGFSSAEEGAVTVSAASGSRTFAAAVVAVGFRPRTELAAAAGLTVGRGIVCDRRFATTDPAIWAVGDAAEVDGVLYPFVVPIVSQAKHLACLLAGKNSAEWTAPSFPVRIKVHGFR
jgi:nitric oxide reductase FlRd-NAD(+) reductase